MIIRRERPSDHQASRQVHVAAFDQGDQTEPPEAHLLDELRLCDGWLPALSWVAQIDGRVIGHAICTRGHVDDVPCVALGPIGILPTSQRTGIGSALMHAMIGAADAQDESLIALLGDPGYYSRFGFVLSLDLGIAPPQPEWRAHFQVLPLTAWSDAISGSFRYATPFEAVS